MRQFSCGYFLLWIACQEDISHRVWENVAFLIPCFKATIFFAYNYSFARTTIFKSQLCEEEEKSFSVGVK